MKTGEEDGKVEPKAGGRVFARRHSDRQIKSTAKILQQEARRILRKQAPRIAAEPAEAIRACIAAIDTHRVAADLPSLEQEAERLDELLHQHASFARKSALRETLENVGVAVIIALGLRSCFYEPFKIPSGSMMPTLRKGDHIFVNKFTYGIQIPFTTTVVGESWGEIVRGEVLVFRFPLDTRDDYIKRVMGLPGDQVRVTGRRVEIKRAGESEFVVLPRRELDQPCINEDGDHEVSGCQLFEETYGERTYVVRYTNSLNDRDGLFAPSRTLEVPPGHLLVMGDNRNQSHDSWAWVEHVEAVAADQLLTIRDLHDLTPGRSFTTHRPETEATTPANHDQVTYANRYRSKAHDVGLELWRSPPIDAGAVFRAVVAELPEGSAQSFEALLPEGSAGMPQFDRAFQVGGALDAVHVGEDDERRYVAAYLAQSNAVFVLSCGREQCPRAEDLGVPLSEAVGAFEADPRRDSKALLPMPEGERYTTDWDPRLAPRQHFHQASYGEADTPERRVRIRIFRKPNASLDVLEAAALRELGTSAASATPVPSHGERAWISVQPSGLSQVAFDPTADALMILDCGRSICPDRAAFDALVDRVWPKFNASVADARKLKNVLLASDVGGLPALPTVGAPSAAFFDRVTYEATVEGRGHQVDVEVWRRPEEGLPAKVAALRQQYDLDPDDAVSPGGAASHEGDAHHLVFVAPGSESVVRIRCETGLCADDTTALALARRTAKRAAEPRNFVDPDAERPRPFVPRGHVKGRAERIWLPLSRFWLPIR